MIVPHEELIHCPVTVDRRTVEVLRGGTVFEAVARDRAWFWIESFSAATGNAMKAARRTWQMTNVRTERNTPIVSGQLFYTALADNRTCLSRR